MRRIYILNILLTLFVTAWAQIHVSAPSHVATDENFRLAYTINTQDVQGFRGGNVPEGLEVLAGPYTSSQSSFQSINGHTTSSSSVTYTYTIYAGKPGTYTIGPAHAKIGNRTVTSASVKITVSGKSHGGGSAQGSQPQQQMRTSTRITDSDLFIRVTANKQTVKEQEPVLLTYKVYAKADVDLTQLDIKMPDLKGFHTQEVQLPQQKSFHMESVGGRAYRACTWSQYVLYPQMTGKLQIPTLTFKGVVAVANNNVDPFEAFLNGGSGYVEVKKDVVAKGMTITVEQLPDKPANFSGGVGKFSISGQLLLSSVKANDAVTLRIVVSGNGNLKLLKQPQAQWPKDFDKYDTKVTDKTKLTGNGLEGNMVYDLLAAPRNKGDYEIPAIEFTYYDTQAGAYKTIKTGPFKLHVDAADGSSNSDKPAQNDILPIKMGSDSTLAADCFYGSATYWTIIIIVLVVFIALIWIFRKRAIERADIVKMRGKRANKVATKRLKRAAQLMHQNKEAEFYDEVLRALWGYVGDKLNIPVVELSRDNITERLQSHNVEEQSINTFVAAIDECEYARYAPGEAKGKMANVYEKAAGAITDIDRFLNNKKKMPKATIILILLLSVCSLSANANGITKAMADKDYTNGNYVKAITEYKQLIKQTPSAELYYNLAGAYYRTDSLSQAVLAYERAHKIDPSDEQISSNLAFVSTKTIDKMQPASEIFIIAWWQSLSEMFTLTTWAVLSIVSLSLVVILLLVYLFAYAVWLRQTGFFGGIAMLVIFILCNALALTEKAIMNDDSGAVVTVPACPVKKSPEQKSADQKTIHEATRVNITDSSVKGWYEVTLEDGTDGWIESKCVERI